APPYSTSSSTSLVTSRMVRSPTTLNSSPPSATMRLLLKVISGNFSTERKSSLRRWPSRSATPVLMLSVLMVSSAVDCSGSSAMVTVPEKSEKLPRTLLTIMCLTTKPMVVWATSRVYVPAAGMVRPFQLRVVMRIPYGNECLLRGQLLQQTSTRGIFPPSTNVVYSMDVTNVNDPRLTAFGLLSEVYAGLTARMQPVFAAAGLSEIDFDTLIRLGRSPRQALRMTDLAAQTGLSTSGVTRVVDRLERDGLVVRQACATDR